MNRTQVAARNRPLTISVTDALYNFLKANHKFEAFEGRNQDRFSDYSVSVARSYQRILDACGFGRIPAYESCSGEAVFFDQQLRLVEGERLRFAQRREFLEFDQRAFLASVTLSPYEIQTLSLGECVMGISVSIGGKQTVLVWSGTQKADPESRVLTTINQAICNSNSASTFTELIRVKRADVCVEVCS